MDLGKIIEQVLEDKNITKKAFSTKMGISRQTLDNWIKGVTFPTSDDLSGMSKILDVDLTNHAGEALTLYGAKRQKETWYAELIEKNETYALIPKAVLRDYKMVPDKVLDTITQSHEGEREALIARYKGEREALIAEHQLLITGLENKAARLEADVKRLEEENRELERQISAKTK